MSSPDYVYQLSDPETGEVRWVGVSRNPVQRFRDHLRDKTNPDKLVWVDDLRQRDLQPVLSILETLDAEANAGEVEYTWISRRLGEGHRLFNRVLQPLRRRSKTVNYDVAIFLRLETSLHEFLIEEATRQNITVSALLRNRIDHMREARK